MAVRMGDILFFFFLSPSSSMMIDSFTSSYVRLYFPLAWLSIRNAYYYLANVTLRWTLHFRLLCVGFMSRCGCAMMPTWVDIRARKLAPDVLSFLFRAERTISRVADSLLTFSCMCKANEWCLSLFERWRCGYQERSLPFHSCRVGVLRAVSFSTTKA